jgi:hypothetical protein
MHPPAVVSRHPYDGFRPNRLKVDTLNYPLVITLQRWIIFETLIQIPGVGCKTNQGRQRSTVMPMYAD